MNRSMGIAALVAAAAMGMPAAYAASPGAYVGVSGMQSRFDSDNFDVEDVDEEDTGWKAVIGYRFTPNLAVEGGYTRFGTAEAPAVAVGGPFEAKAKALSAFGVGIFPAGPVDLFLKAGVGRIDAEGNVGAVLFEEKEMEFAYGAGAQFNFGNLGLRAEYEKFDTDVIGDLDVISVGFVLTFPAP